MPHLGVPDDMDDWHWAMPAQPGPRGRAPRVEHFRSLVRARAGAIVWQLNDCWPVTSWAAVDGDGRRKPLLYALRAAFADRLVTVQPARRASWCSRGQRLRPPWVGAVAVRRERFDGTLLADSVLTLDVPPARSRSSTFRRTCAPRSSLAARSSSPSSVTCRTVHTWLDDVELDLDPDPWARGASGSPTGTA